MGLYFVKTCETLNFEKHLALKNKRYGLYVLPTRLTQKWLRTSEINFELPLWKISCP